MKTQKIDKSQLFTTAWGIARAAAAKFGGSCRQYFSQALKQAWAASSTASSTPSLIERIEKFAEGLESPAKRKRVQIALDSFRRDQSEERKTDLLRTAERYGYASGELDQIFLFPQIYHKISEEKEGIFKLRIRESFEPDPIEESIIIYDKNQGSLQISDSPSQRVAAVAARFEKLGGKIIS